MPDPGSSPYQPHNDDAQEGTMNTTDGPVSTHLSIDSDPEFFHGLTFWGEKISAQISEASTLTERLDELVVHHLIDGEGVADLHIPAPDARRLRDLLNLATARGFL